MDLKQLYKQINDATIRDYPVSSLHDMITVQCCTNPDGIAVLDAQASQTYAELDRKSNELANYLQLLGIGAGDLVGLCCDRNVDTPAMLVGIMKSGAGYVPLDPDSLSIVWSTWSKIQKSNTSSATRINCRCWRNLILLLPSLSAIGIKSQPQVQKLPQPKPILPKTSPT